LATKKNNLPGMVLNFEIYFQVIFQMPKLPVFVHFLPLNALGIFDGLVPAKRHFVRGGRNNPIGM
jgi:hypothetical protein